MSVPKLAFAMATPEHVVLPIPMSRGRWFELADLQNTVRAAAMQRCWYRHEMEDVYAELYPT